MFLKFIKSYLGVQKSTNNAISYFLTSTEPLSIRLKKLAPNCTGSLSFLASFKGIKLSFLSNDTMESTAPFDVLEKIPPWFWYSKAVNQLPLDPKYRRQICMEVTDSNHYKLCCLQKFHVKIEEECRCSICFQKMEHYHERFCGLVSQKDQIS